MIITPNLKDKVALVTGGSRGIGAAVAVALAEAGAAVAVNYRERADAADALVADLNKAGHRAVAIAADVSQASHVTKMFERVTAVLGPVDVLVNNAGIPGRTRFLDGDPRVIERLIRINYLGGVWCLRAFLPGLRAAAPSDVVNIVSVSGVVAEPRSGPYAASKHAQLAFSRAAAAELRRERIRVHTVKPGFTETEGFPQSWLPRRVQRVVSEPGEVAAHVLRSLEHGRGETTVPWYYGPVGPLQDAMPNVFTRVLGGAPKAP